MKAVIQRVSRASVSVDGETISEIGNGLLVLLGVGYGDDENDIAWLSRKIVNLRIFNDENGVMNKSLVEQGGDAIVVSQFTLQASTKKGNRPSYIKAANPDIAIPLYEKFVQRFQIDLAKDVGTGVFGADMKVDLLNDGPVTIIIDTKSRE
ncbi:D-tyrosyl-tRNA(Tyr) deacylase [Maribacter sp. ANRC-HE7]|uniref:D-aminoacyl-tRNA deacylase n=1 Tax=Maribacter aquimaris TaxID=2737171 RepID=A0ABR7V173_9FLAO|nr:D-aminoacyl-tRNA deacylase [Maribacter aquimaris]MBD0778553.1 D-tyrosyl-tRNA(Tyr) deacylase [Maribacter aquimaris]